LGLKRGSNLIFRLRKAGNELELYIYYIYSGYNPAKT
jgi:hypothetical protein